MINRFSNFIFDFLSLIAPGFMLIFLLFLLLMGVDPNGNTDHAELTAIFTIADGKCQRSCRLEGGTTNETGKRKEALDS